MNYRSPEDMSNCTIIMEFFLMEYSSIRELQVLHAILFLFIYIAALMGNLLTVTAIVTDPHLHSPMYFFLSNLSLLDLGCISVTLPKFIVNSLTGIQSISLLGCAAQVFFLIFFVATEIFLLVAMSYDRFVAICHPLHYGVIMTPIRCLWAATGSWLSGFIYSAAHTGNMFRLPFSGSNVIHQFFCDIPHVLKVSSPEVRPELMQFLAIHNHQRSLLVDKSTILGTPSSLHPQSHSQEGSMGVMVFLQLVKLAKSQEIRSIFGSIFPSKQMFYLLLETQVQSPGARQVFRANYSLTEVPVSGQSLRDRESGLLPIPTDSDSENELFEF
ncbi:olfactory receptor 14I1-like [Sarcophilus harrisii]